MEWIQETNQENGPGNRAACLVHVCSAVGPGNCGVNVCLTKGICYPNT